MRADLEAMPFRCPVLLYLAEFWLETDVGCQSAVVTTQSSHDCLIVWLGSTISRTAVLWCLFLGSVVLSVGFKMWMPSAGGVLLDGQLTSEAARQLLMNMTESEKAAHMIDHQETSSRPSHNP